tara:strand:- start:384 stop:1526 length:1143 start_codon:yes stop_codon:yes gene_type:complete
MGKIYTALGLMSGTSMDGVDASIIKSDGADQFTNIYDEYYEFDTKIYKNLIELRKLIFTHEHLNNFSKEINDLERELTLFHNTIINEISSKYNGNIDIIGFHGQTIFHNPQKQITRQLGDGNLLSQLSKKIVIYDFRKNDLLNKGQGAPLTPIYHYLLSDNIRKKFNDKFSFINIGGISNITIIKEYTDSSNKKIEAFDIGPGNCLIDEWIRKNSNLKYDKDGLIGQSGKINRLILNHAIDNFNILSYEQSLDVKDFDTNFAKGLSLEDGCATVTNFTAYLISEGLKSLNRKNKKMFNKYLMCGGGRKNKFLVSLINQYLENENNIILKQIDDYNFNGDFIESQAFGYLAIRSYLGLPISFPSTTRCQSPSTGGIIAKNF